MVKPGAVFLEPGLQGMIRRERFNQLQLGITEVEVGQPDGAFHDVFAIE